MLHLLMILDNLHLFLVGRWRRDGGLSPSLKLHFLGCQFFISDPVLLSTVGPLHLRT